MEQWPALPVIWWLVAMTSNGMVHMLLMMPDTRVLPPNHVRAVSVTPNHMRASTVTSNRMRSFSITPNHMRASQPLLLHCLLMVHRCMQRAMGRAL